MNMMLRPLDEVRDQMERLFADMTEDWHLPSRFRPDNKLFKFDQNGIKTWLSPVEVSETDSEYIVKAEIPGIKPEDIDVEVLGNVITIQGETKSEKKEEKKDLYRSELRYGRFFREIPLPSEVKGDDCKAEFRHGILELHLPKLENHNRKRVKLNLKSN